MLNAVKVPSLVQRNVPLIPSWKPYKWMANSLNETYLQEILVPVVIMFDWLFVWMNASTMIPCRPWFPAANHVKSPTRVAPCDYPQKLIIRHFVLKSIQCKEKHVLTPFFSLKDRKPTEIENWCIAESSKARQLRYYHLPELTLQVVPSTACNRIACIFCYV